MAWLTRSFAQYSILWLLLSGVIGGVVGAGVKFVFEDVLRPRVGWRRDARRAVRGVTVPLLRAADSLERWMNNWIRNVEAHWYQTSDYYRLATLHSFAEYLGWVRIIERRFGYVAIEASRAGARFNTRLNGFFRATSSFSYFRWSSESEKVAESSVPRKMFTAMGDVMICSTEPPTVLTFSDFCVRYETDAQFRRWFADLHEFLLAADPEHDPFRWDRLIAAAANLRALAVELDTDERITRAPRIVNLDRLAHPELREILTQEFPKLTRPTA
jgi:hypothetical protein